MNLPGPGGNWKGYENSDLSAKAMNFYGKNYFLIHGTADDNVHFQQSMVLTRALVDYNILFRLQVSEIQKPLKNLHNAKNHQKLNTCCPKILQCIVIQILRCIRYSEVLRL